MRRRRTRRTSRLETFDGINITPFTDVLLVLLIIFMIAGSSLAPTGVGMSGLAQEESDSEPPRVELGLTVNIAPDGSTEILVGDRSLHWDDVKELQPVPSVTLSVDPKASAEQVVRVYDRLLSVGLSNIRWGPPSRHPMGSKP